MGGRLAVVVDGRRGQVELKSREGESERASMQSRKWVAGSPRTRVKRRQGFKASLVMLSSGCARWFTGELARASVRLGIGMGRANSVLSQVKAVVVPCNVQPFRLPWAK